MLEKVYLVGVIAGYIIGMLRVHPIVFIVCVVAYLLAIGIVRSGGRCETDDNEK